MTKTSSVVALGFFDGVHLGHGKLLEAARREADRLGVPALALTFDPHPSVLVEAGGVPLLSCLEERAHIMESRYGIDRLVVLPFDEAMRRMSWEDFFHHVLIERLGAVHLVCGADYRFGRGGRGNALLLQAACREAGLGCQVIPSFSVDGEPVSSTRIRALIQGGDMEQAARLLGYPYALTGRVIHGRGLGRTMGIPTANLQWEAGILPPHGVYASKAHTPQGTYLAVTNIGTRPTVAGDHITVEPYLLDFSGNLYDQRLRLELYARLRPELHFPDLESLKAEICRNAEQTRAYFEERA